MSSANCHGVTGNNDVSDLCSYFNKCYFSMLLHHM